MVEVRNPSEQFPERDCHLLIEIYGDDEYDWNDDERNYRKFRVDRQHDAESAEQCHYSDEQIFGAVVCHLPDVHQIIRQTCQQPAGLRIIKEAVGKSLDIAVRLISDITLNVRAGHVTPVCNADLKQRVEQIDCHTARCCQEYELDSFTGQQLVDEQVDHEGEGEFKQPDDDRTCEIQHEQCFIWCIIGEEFLQG